MGTLSTQTCNQKIVNTVVSIKCDLEKKDCRQGSNTLYFITPARSFLIKFENPDCFDIAQQISYPTSECFRRVHLYCMLQVGLFCQLPSNIVLSHLSYSHSYYQSEGLCSPQIALANLPIRFKQMVTAHSMLFCSQLASRPSNFVCVGSILYETS